MALNAKQARFVDEYLVDLNATQAAIRAGYSEKTARQQASDLLAHPDIDGAIQAARHRLSEATGITQERVLNEIAKLAFANIGDYINVVGKDPHIDLSKCTPEQFAALTETTFETYMEGHGEDAQIVKRVKIKMADKYRGLEMLAKHLGLLSKTADDGDAVPLTINISAEPPVKDVRVTRGK